MVEILFKATGRHLR